MVLVREEMTVDYEFLKSTWIQQAHAKKRVDGWQKLKETRQMVMQD